MGKIFEKKYVKNYDIQLKNRKKKSIDDENNDIDDDFIYLEFDVDP